MTTTREIPRDIADTAREARDLLDQAKAMTVKAAPMMRAVARHLYAQGWKQREIALVLKVSTQRVSQLLEPPNHTTKA